MKTITLLTLLTFLSVDVAHAKKPLIRQIIDIVRELKEDPQYAEKYVGHIFDKEKCECKDFCVAQNILHPILPHHHKLPRALYAYTGLKDKDCPYTSGDQYQLKDLMNDIIQCAQAHNHGHKRCLHNTTEHRNIMAASSIQ